MRFGLLFLGILCLRRSEALSAFPGPPVWSALYRYLTSLIARLPVPRISRMRCRPAICRSLVDAASNLKRTLAHNFLIHMFLYSLANRNTSFASLRPAASASPSHAGIIQRERPACLGR
ncbi:hypothetical protein HDK90DRAFT_144143 [Phyllosticta capitalensis]|uniref:Secreted protein n=1 Tax=Phyllosticta capitalensis TaxID=121624 RepID=A0ABR1YZM4_9PEZI